MSYASDIIDLRRCRTLAGCCSGLVGPQGPQGPQGPGVAPSYASFVSNTTQPTVRKTAVPNSVAITYDLRTVGTFDVVGGIYPSSQILIPATGVYRILFSAQCDSTTGIHDIEIFPVINGVSVPDSNTRITIDFSIESCLTVEYFLSFNANDIFEFRMTGDDTSNAANARLLYEAAPLPVPGNTIMIPAIPSMIVVIQRID